MRFGAALGTVIGSCYEIHRNKFSTLMQELEVRVLSVGAGCAPDDAAGIVFDRCALLICALAKTLHTQLLQERR